MEKWLCMTSKVQAAGSAGISDKVYLSTDEVFTEKAKCTVKSPCDVIKTSSF